MYFGDLSCYNEFVIKLSLQILICNSNFIYYKKGGYCYEKVFCFTT